MRRSAEEFLPLLNSIWLLFDWCVFFRGHWFLAVVQAVAFSGMPCWLCRWALLESPRLRMGLGAGPDRVDHLQFRPARSFTLFWSSGEPGPDRVNCVGRRSSAGEAMGIGQFELHLPHAITCT